MIELRENYWAVELTNLGDQYKSFTILEPDKKWTVPYLKYSYRSIYHTKNRGNDFFCSEEDPLEPGTWQIVCTSKEATEEQANDIVEWEFQSSVRIGFRNYITEKQFDLHDAIQSLNSLLSSKGCDLNKHYLILKKG